MLKKLKSLLCPKGCGKLFLFANPTTPNTATVTDGAGASKIAYSPSFVKSVQTTYGPIATLGIFAHELGHHLEATGNRPAWMKASWDSELRADAWAGCAMAKAELKPSGLQAVLLALSEYPSAKHPAWSARRPVITEGYKQCGGRMLPPLAKESRRAGRDRDRDARARTTAPVAGRGAGRLHRRQGLPQRARVREQPVRRRARAPALRQGHRLPGSRRSAARPASARAPPARRRAEPEPAKPAAPMLARRRCRHGAPGGAAARRRQRSDAAACLKTCDEVRNLCVDAATSEGNKCLADDSIGSELPRLLVRELPQRATASATPSAPAPTTAARAARRRRWCATAAATAIAAAPVPVELAVAATVSSQPAGSTRLLADQQRAQRRPGGGEGVGEARLGAEEAGPAARGARRGQEPPRDGAEPVRRAQRRAGRHPRPPGVHVRHAAIVAVEEVVKAGLQDLERRRVPAMPAHQRQHAAIGLGRCRRGIHGLARTSTRRSSAEVVFQLRIVMLL